MKKIYPLLILLLLAAVNTVSAQYIVGPLNVCSGQTATYTVYGPSCMVQIDGPDGLDAGNVYSHSPGSSTFTITWSNTTMANKTDNFDIYISAMVYYPDGSRT